RDRAGADGALSCERAEIERGLYRARRCQARSPGTRLADAARAYPECANKADEESRLWQRLRIRSRRRGQLLRPELFSGWHGARNLLHAARHGVRAGDCQTARILVEAASEKERSLICSPAFFWQWPSAARSVRCCATWWPARSSIQR